MHVKEESSCPTHCRKFSLSNKEGRSTYFRDDCSHQHIEICQECENVFLCLEAFKELITGSGLDSETKDELVYDYSTASAYITAWMKHILRGVHTQSTKEKIIEKSLKRTERKWRSGSARKVSLDMSTASSSEIMNKG